MLNICVFQKWTQTPADSVVETINACKGGKRDTTNIQLSKNTYIHFPEVNSTTPLEPIISIFVKAVSRVPVLDGRMSPLVSESCVQSMALAIRVLAGLLADGFVPFG